ncbi:uncharacterized protein JCM15063_000196 [Sporobolomyces koalae]|uniref:uncharacterized protein n=1 Tax=Sporobolomyces koalae TaxID=500713 RepID=UPI003175667D
MDIYTTSFCLPRSAAHSADLTTSANSTPSTSFDYGPRDGTTTVDDDGRAPHAPGQGQAQNQRNPSSGSHQSTLSDGAVPPAGALGSSGENTGSAGSSANGSGESANGVHHNGGSLHKRGSVDLNDVMQRLCVDTMAAHQCIVSFSPVDPPSASPNLSSGPDGNASNDKTASSKLYNFHLSGGYQQVMSARGSILRENPFKRKSVVKVPRAEVLDGKENVKVEMRRKLDEIASLTKAHLAIVGQANGTIGFGLETERNVEIVITGPYESVEQARVRLLVLLDELSGLHSEVCEIDYKLHNIISGRKRCVVQTIQEETATNIYFPTPLSGVIGGKTSSLQAKQNLIFITGEFFGVQRARDMLFQVSLHKSKCIISRDTAILPRKLDWMLSDRLEDLKQIMNDNGTFINFPPLGSQASLISVYGDHRVNIERSIRAIMGLACQLYVASFWLLPISFDVFMPPSTINPAQIPPILRHISVTSGAEAVFKSNCFEFHGLEAEVRQAVQLVLELDFVKSFHHEIRFQIELANEHREFISGKKNGKLNKIMKSANVKIKFETFNDYNFLIDVAGSDPGALHGLTMLQEELPAEISFHVPEAYHKRIIGVGGKNIQRIMKKYGVYVKFSNAEEFAALGGYNDNEDNVIARTPAKNAMNLEHLKQSVMELVSPKDKDFIVETVSIPRRYHRTLLGEKSIFIHDIEAKTNSAVRFPSKETASDVVSIFGPESQVHIAAQMLLDHVPFEAEYRLPHSTEMAALTLSQDFVNLTEKIKRDLNITILPWVDRSGAGEETIIRFCLNRSNVDFLATSRDLVEEYLVQRKIDLYPGSLRPRSESFADVFAPFNSKLLSTSNIAGGDADHRPEPRPGSDRKLRLAASSPNIKAIFDANPGGPASSQLQAFRPNQGIPEQPHQHQQHDYPGYYPAPPPPVPQIPHQYQQQPPYVPAGAAPGQMAHGHASPFAPLPPPPPPHQAEYHWGMPRVQMGYPNAQGYATGYNGYSAAATPTQRLSHDDLRSPPRHGGSASLPFPSTDAATPRASTNAAQASVEDQLKELSSTASSTPGRQPRGLGPRAQSLDLSQHNFRGGHHGQSASVAFPNSSRPYGHEDVDEVSGVLSQLGIN